MPIPLKHNTTNTNSNFLWGFGGKERIDGVYEYSFNGFEKDDEVKGEGNHISFEDYGYDSRLGRRWRTDPLQLELPSWSPYLYSLDNPIMFVDDKGEYPGVTYWFYEIDVGGGLGFGVNYVRQSGIAYDEVGKTHFTMTSKLYIVNQNLKESSLNPEIVAGLGAAFNIGVTFDWSNETFLGDISGYNGEFGGVEFYDIVGGGIGFGDSRISFKIGIGFGVKISVLNTQVEESISLTDKEADVVNDATDVVTESWIVNNRKYDAEKDVWTGTVATKDTKGNLIDTGIKITSANIQDDEGNNAPSGVWSSKAYQKEAAQAEKEEQ